MNAGLRDDCEVAVVGAGPYGLAVAAHLTDAGIGVRVFGDPMSFWRDNMPKGMKLRSPWHATHIADPHKTFSLDAFVGRREIDPVPDQQPLEHFVRYGEWFQRQAVPDVDGRKVMRIEDAGKGFRLLLEGEDVVHARRIVIATGLAKQEFRPAPFTGLPSALVSHTCEHAMLDHWRGKRVAVVGRGQSACESAALLREAGSEVELISRGDIHWIGAPDGEAGQRQGWLWRLRELLQAPSAVGPPPLNWLNELPGIEHRLPARLRAWISARSLRAAAVWWVKPRFEGVRVKAGQAIVGAQAEGDRVAVQLDDGPSTYDHVLLATGYKIDIAKVGLLAPELLHRIVCTDGSPVLAAGFESSVPGLHFVGSSSVRSFGPLMRFIAGAGYAARQVTGTVLARRLRQEVAGVKTTVGGFSIGRTKDALRG
jgi:cation diffusion facilitator CzcD-associated flavoprotein CzcO